MNSFSLNQSIKAILTGALFIIISSLLMKIVYIFVAAAYHNLSIDYPYLNEVNGFFRYLIAIPVFVAIMFAGGYITAGIARRKTLIHSVIVGITAITMMMIVALQSSAGITLTNIIVYIVMLLATTAGGYYWKYKATN